MKTEEYGKQNDSIIVLLHGANFVHCFGRQYPLSSEYRLIVPHIMGFGDEADRVFDTDACVKELAGFIAGLEKKVLLVGFSLGAQLAFKLISEYPHSFYSAIIVSPWLIKEKDVLKKVMTENEKHFRSFKNKRLCRLIAFVNGLPRDKRKEFVEQMQRVSIETIRNSVDNGITLESEPAFAAVDFPVIALAGGKEQKDVTDSVKKMAGINRCCKYEIWDRAAHNIPPMFAKKFNKLIIDTARK